MGQVCPKHETFFEEKCPWCEDGHERDSVPGIDFSSALEQLANSRASTLSDLFKQAEKDAANEELQAKLKEELTQAAAEIAARDGNFEFVWKCDLCSAVGWGDTAGLAAAMRAAHYQDNHAAKTGKWLSAEIFAELNALSDRLNHLLKEIQVATIWVKQEPEQTTEPLRPPGAVSLKPHCCQHKKAECYQCASERAELLRNGFWKLATAVVDMAPAPNLALEREVNAALTVLREECKRWP